LSVVFGIGHDCQARPTMSNSSTSLSAVLSIVTLSSYAMAAPSPVESASPFTRTAPRATCTQSLRSCVVACVTLSPAPSTVA